MVKLTRIEIAYRDSFAAYAKASWPNSPIPKEMGEDGPIVDLPSYSVRDYFNDPSRPGFLEWGLKVDRLCENTLGLGILDLPDRDYSAAFADGLRPTQVLAKIIDEFGLN